MSMPLRGTMTDLAAQLGIEMPNADEARNKRTAYWPVLAQVPDWARKDWTPDALEGYDGNLDHALMDTMSCLRCRGDCQTLSHDGHFYGPYIAALAQCRRAWLDACDDAEQRGVPKPAEPHYPVDFAFRLCPGAAQRKADLQKELLPRNVTLGSALR